MSEAAWDAVFQQEGGDASTLAEGIRAKIIAAAQATEEGDTLLIPSRGAHASAGKQWRIVLELAGARDLTSLELQHFIIWLEERWGVEVANGFALPLKTVTLAPPSLRAPIVAPPAPADPPAPEPEDEAAKLFGARSPPAASGATAGGKTMSRDGTGMVPKTTEQKDIDAHPGVTTSIELAILTWTHLYARTPDPNNEAVKYGTHPEGTKLAKTFSSAPGATLRALVDKKTTTLADYRDYFRTAHQALVAYPAIQSRLIDHWQELQRFLHTPEMIAAYYRKSLPSMTGRGIPDLFDQSILLQVVCEKVTGPSDDTLGEIKTKFGDLEKKCETMATKMDKMADSIDKVTAVKNDLSNLKNEVANVKSGVAELKKKPAAGGGDKYCAWCDSNGFAESAYTHNEDKCGRKKAANK